MAARWPRHLYSAAVIEHEVPRRAVVLRSRMNEAVPHIACATIQAVRLTILALQSGKGQMLVSGHADQAHDQASSCWEQQASTDVDPHCSTPCTSALYSVHMLIPLDAVSTVSHRCPTLEQPQIQRHIGSVSCPKHGAHYNRPGHTQARINSNRQVAVPLPCTWNTDVWALDRTLGTECICRPGWLTPCGPSTSVLLPAGQLALPYMTISRQQH